MIADDLFAGAGGWSLAAAALGIRDRGVEIMPAARATREAADLETIHDDVWTFKPPGGAAGQIASPPCPTFSTAGSGSGRRALGSVLAAIDAGAYKSLNDLRAHPVDDDDARTRLVLTPLHFATQYGYEWIAWEQVPTVLPVWEACAVVLRAEGWHTWTGTVTAEQYGVPQTRKRAILLARRDRPVVPPLPTHSRYHNRTPARLDVGVARWVSMAEGIGWGLQQRPSFTITGGSQHAASGIEWGGKSTRDLLLGLSAGGDRDLWAPKGWGLTERPAPTVTGGGVETGGAEPIAKLNRYTGRPDWMPRSHIAPSGSSCTIMAPRPTSAPSPTITGKGNAEWTDRARPAKPGELRDRDAIRLEPHEAGILQTFPADHPWQGNRGKQFLQAGNAIPPLLAYRLLEAVATP